MNPTLWAFASAAIAVGAEYLYRTLPGSWGRYLWLWIPMQLAIGYGICHLVRTPGVPLVGALIMWSFAVIGLRIFVSTVLLHDHVAPGTWCALGLLILARIAQSTWT